MAIGGWGANFLDMKTMVQPYSDPDRRGIAQSMGQYYGLPMFTLAGCTDAKCVDQQAAIEAALTLMTVALGGGHIVHDLGYLESGLCYSLAQLVICDEILNWLDRSLSEIEVNEETMAVDVIDEVGPDGQYLDNEHTLRHFRKLWYPSLFERDIYENWQAKGGKTLAERAAERVEKILLEHKPEPLPVEVVRAVHAIVERAEEQYGKE
jgi:trimethylamine--corrinoid protein Co-methyltransferase